VKRSIVVVGGPMWLAKEVAQAAEAGGLHRVWLTEGTNSDAIVRAVAAGAVTSSVLIGTGIAYSFVRPPLHMAATAADVQEALDGRFALGIGPGTRGIRRRYGIVEDHPAPRFGEYVDLMKAALATEHGFEFSGRFFTSSAPLLHYEGDRERRLSLPIYGSGLNRFMLESAAAHCDGIALHPLTGIEPYLQNVTLPAIERGAERGSERGTRRPVLAMWHITSVHPDRTIARQRAAIVLAFYFSTPSYARTLEGTGWEGVATTLQEEFRKRTPPIDWSLIAEKVPDDMLDAICLAGTAEDVAAKTRVLEERYAKAGIEELVFEPTSHGGVEMLAQSCSGIVAAAGIP
jgi:alkanesulfonate monooxygenase SsuD/methylene tetrahydromethanopterin reductase-like flavin-dependent oxidoreductase (luciferase family)